MSFLIIKIVAFLNNMNYIVDANNLAGALGLLSEEDFDQKLIESLKKFNEGKGRKIFLVFDGGERMGDRISVENNIEVIYTPRDDYYKSADDKIVELVSLNLCGNELIVISDDIELQTRVKKISEEKNVRITIEKASDFVVRLNNKIIKNKNKENSGLSKDEMNNIDKELLNLWNK